MGRDVVAALEQGQALEASGRFEEALAAYDLAHALASASSPDPETQRLRGVIAMNRGNALQRLGSPATLVEAVRAYDAAISTFHALPTAAHPALRLHLGAAWLNRGHALLAVDDASAIPSFENAIATLSPLPATDALSFRVNLAGAHTNLAHATLRGDPTRAAEAARAALRLLAGHEHTHEALAGASLRARRALVMALGALLPAAEAAGAPIDALATEATDVVDDGLALARDLEARGQNQYRSLAQRLFRLGAQLYSAHQPHFLAEFLLDALATPAFAADAGFVTAARAAVSEALTRVREPQLVIADSPHAQRLVETARSLRAAQQHLAALRSER